MKRLLPLFFALLVTACASSGNPASTGTGTTSLADTTPVAQSLVIKGSDTEVQMVSNLAEAYASKNPAADISVTGGGSATGIAALLNGEIDLANSSRDLKDEERAQAAERGLNIQGLIIATDGLAVVVHPENPVRKLTMEVLRDIYAGTITNWKDVGGLDAPIVLYGRQSTSGTYSFFRDAVVKGEYSPQMRNMEGTEAIVDAVKNDRSGIGYAGIGYVLDSTGAPRTDIAIVELPSTGGDNAPVSPLDEEAVLAGHYPIARPIYQFLPKAPEKGSLLAEFLLFETSPDGAAVIEQSGFYKTTADADALNAALLNSLR